MDEKDLKIRALEKTLAQANDLLTQSEQVMTKQKEQIEMLADYYFNQQKINQQRIDDAMNARKCPKHNALINRINMLTLDNIALSKIVKMQEDIINNTYNLEITKVIFNDPVTKIYFSDGTKSIVKAMDGESFDKTTGFTLAILKRILGKNAYYKLIKTIQPGQDNDMVIDVQARKREADAAKEKATEAAASEFPF